MLVGRLDYPSFLLLKGFFTGSVYNSKVPQFNKGVGI